MPRFRPRLTFSIATLLVLVTVLGLALRCFSSEWRIVSERKALLKWIVDKGGGVVHATSGATVSELEMYRAAAIRRLGRVRVMLGDSEVRHLYLPDATADAKDDIARIFPEAEVYDDY